MEELFRRLDELMGGESWPDRWMTVPQILAELDRAGFWAACGRGDAARQEKADVVRSALYHHRDAQDDEVWAEIGGQYKHKTKLTAADRGELVEWCCDRIAHWDRQRLALLEGEKVRPPAPLPSPGPQESLGDAIAQAEELLARVRGIAVGLGWTDLIEFLDQARGLADDRDHGGVSRALTMMRMACMAQSSVVGELVAGRLIPGQLPPAVVELKKAARQIGEVLARCPDFQKLYESGEQDEQ